MGEKGGRRKEKTGEKWGGGEGKGKRGREGR